MEVEVRHRKYAILKLYIDETNQELIELYKNHIEKHNKSMRTNYYPNSGFDIFIPNENIFDIPFNTYMVNMKIKAEMFYFDGMYIEPCAYYIYPRSSISKTPLMLSNHVGVIDSGYRGWLIAALRWLNEISTKTVNENDEYIVKKHTRLLQICHPTLCPIFIEIVKENELSNSERKDGAFGSTGL
jgi:dUTP pyrophosphatase